MKYIKTTKQGAIHVELEDGRLGAVYPSGYVRVTIMNDKKRFYPINKRVAKWTEPKYSEYYSKQHFGGNPNGYLRLYASHKVFKCVLIPDWMDGIDFLFAFEQKNCK